MSNLRFAAIVTVTLVETCAAADACPDGTFPSLDRELWSSSAVVIGQVMSGRYSPKSPGGNWVDGTTFQLAVREVIQGSTAKKLTLFSENSSGRFPMQIGAEYLVFASPCDGQLYVNGRGNSGPVAEKVEVIAKLRTMASLKR